MFHRWFPTHCLVFISSRATTDFTNFISTLIITFKLLFFVTTDKPLNEKLPQSFFVGCHKSYLINTSVQNVWNFRVDLKKALLGRLEEFDWLLISYNNPINIKIWCLLLIQSLSLWYGSIGKTLLNQATSLTN